MYSRLLKDFQFWIALLSAFPVWFVLLSSDYQIQDLNKDGQFLSALVSIGLLYPLVEELCFRGFIQTGLRKSPFLCSTWFGLGYANILTSVLFATLHVFYQPLHMAILIFIPSLVFGYFRDRYNSVTPAMILHVFYNSGWLMFAYVIMSA